MISRLEPPAAESPVWLPNVALPRGSPGSTRAPTSPGYLTKTRHLPEPNTLKVYGGNSASLFSISTLPDMDALGLPCMSTRKKKATSAIPKLPSIDKIKVSPGSGTALAKLAALKQQQQKSALRSGSPDQDSESGDKGSEFRGGICLSSSQKGCQRYCCS